MQQFEIWLLGDAKYFSYSHIKFSLQEVTNKKSIIPVWKHGIHITNSYSSNGTSVGHAWTRALGNTEGSLRSARYSEHSDEDSDRLNLQGRKQFSPSGALAPCQMLHIYDNSKICILSLILSRLHSIVNQNGTLYLKVQIIKLTPVPKVENFYKWLQCNLNVQVQCHRTNLVSLSSLETGLKKTREINFQREQIYACT